MLPTKVEERIALINKLTKDRADIDAQLRVLTGLEQEESKIPLGFDYKDAIFTVFQENHDKILGLDDIVRQISFKYKFTPDRDIITKQTTLLVDRHKKIERIEGRRGKYRLK